MQPSIALPPLLYNSQSQIRKVGFEIEFTGISLATIAELVAQVFTGKVQSMHRNRLLVKTASYGDFSVELDVKLLQRLAQELGNTQQREQLEYQLKQFTIDMLSPMLATIAPAEIVTPPLEFTALAQLDKLCQVLREHDAKGTHASLIYAFGIHINPEVPSNDPLVLQRYLLAFVLLYDWLKAYSGADLTRQISQFAKPYPKAYAELLLNKNYRPDLEGLINDYLVYNSTRNRALDMLPLFMHLAANKVRAKIKDQRVKPRPTFHYRLPNCQIDEPNWSILQTWNHWVEVEKLASQPVQLAELAKRYNQHLNSLLYNITASNWIAEVEQWLNNH